MTPELNWLSDPTVFAVNRLDAHSDHVCYRTVQEAAQRHSSLRQPLDACGALYGAAARPSARRISGAKERIFRALVPSVCRAIWRPRAMVSCNTPTRCTRGWTQCAAAPQVDLNDDPVGSYAREFDLDAGLRGQRVCISFQGVEQAMYCGAMASSWAMPRTALPPRNLT